MECKTMVCKRRKNSKKEGGEPDCQHTNTATTIKKDRISNRGNNTESDT